MFWCANLWVFKYAPALQTDKKWILGNRDLILTNQGGQLTYNNEG